MKALRKPFKMRMRITGINHLIGEEFQSAAPFRQPQAQLNEQGCDTWQGILKSIRICLERLIS
jgi:hypothetical protein